MTPKKRILHVVGQLDIGGIESWLVDLISYTFDEYEYFIIVDKHKIGYYEETLINLGCKIFRVSSSKNKLQYILDMHRVVSTIKPDVCHSHVSYTNGIIAAIARLARVKKVISHSHSNRTDFYNSRNFLGKISVHFKILLARSLSSHLLSVSDQSAISHYNSIKGVNILPCGRDFTSLLRQDEILLPGTFGLAANDTILVNIGRLVTVKNQAFLIQLLPYLPDNFKLLIVGDGDQYEHLQKTAEKYDVKDRVTFLGARTDTLLILRDIAHVFLFPSHFEGLGLAAIEAQAAGLPVLASDSIPDSVCLTPNYHKIRVTDPNLWVRKIMALVPLRRKNEVNIDICIGQYSIVQNIKSLREIYNA